MENQIIERIKIGESFIPYTKEFRNKGKKKLFNITFLGILTYPIAMLSLLFAIYITVTILFKLESSSYIWENEGLFIALTMTFSLSTPKIVFQLLIEKHLKKLDKNLYLFNKELNANFEDIVRNANKHAISTGIPLILIFIAALFQEFGINPFWNNFLIPVFLVCLYSLTLINYNILKLWTNIRKVESTIDKK